MEQSEDISPELRWWDFLATLLLVAVIFTATARLVATKWTEHLGLVQTVGFFGAILGLALGWSVFSRRVVFILSFAYGVFVVPWQLGLTLGSGIDWNERLESLWGRLEIVLRELLLRRPITDNILFLLLMACMFWILSVHAGYTLIRYANAWRVIIPGGLATFVIHSFDPLIARRTWYLAFYLFFALLLLARVVYIKNRRHWRQDRVHTPPDIGFDLTRFAILVAVVIVLFSWNVPVLADTLEPAAQAWRTLSQPWLTLKDRMSFAFASLRASVGLVSDYYGDNLILGRGNILSDRIILEVEAPRAPFVGARFYWRLRVYDKYEGSNWSSNFADTRPLSSNSLDLAIPGVDNRISATFKFRPYDAISQLFVVPQPLWISRPAQAHLVQNPDGTVDLDRLQAQPVIRPGERYEVRSSLSGITISSLRAAGADYPQWVTDRYLQLPDEITGRTIELARRITEGAESPYDMAESITLYLRENIEYSDFVPDAPMDQERMDWFLFDYRKGFCNYYATAEIIMLRSLGIPARMAVGYSQGERLVGIEEVITPGPGDILPEDTTPLKDTVDFVVRQRNAHAWPEVYFPGIGWVEFEPTASEDPLLRPMGGNELDEEQDLLDRQDLPDPFDRPDPRDELMEGLEDPSQWAVPDQMPLGRRIALYGFLFLALGLLGVLIWQIRRGFELAPVLQMLSVRIPVQLEQGLLRIGIHPPAFLSNWALYATLPSLSRSYLEVNRALSRLGRPPTVGLTPAERVGTLSIELPPAADPAQRLLTEYHTATYSLDPADPLVARQAGKEIRRLSLFARFQRLLTRIQEPPRRRMFE